MRKKTLGSILADDGTLMKVCKTRSGFLFLSLDGRNARDDSYGCSQSEFERIRALVHAIAANDRTLDPKSWDDDFPQ